MSVITRPDLLQLESYNYVLPEDRIAQHPVSPRDSSRLMALDRSSGAISDHTFRELPELLQPGDLLVLNDTRVIPARLRSDRGEVLLVRQTADPQCWDTMVQPGRRFRIGTAVNFGAVKATVVEQSQVGRILRFEGNVWDLLQATGEVPLPPYIQRKAGANDSEQYQTVYAEVPGSVAAPTAGLHFTGEVFDALAQRRIETARITLHVGPGTFRPVKSADITKHTLHAERYECSSETWKRIAEARRVIAVGTTTTRTLEAIARTGQLSDDTDLFIYPGFEFRIVRGMVTNFHLPKSSLLMLVSAFAGFEFVKNAYNHAMESGYRFYSYGDAMVIA